MFNELAIAIVTEITLRGGTNRKKTSCPSPQKQRKFSGSADTSQCGTQRKHGQYSRRACTTKIFALNVPSATPPQPMFKLLRLLLTAILQRLSSPPQNFPSARTALDYWQGEAIVHQEISPGRTGVVRFRGSWWNARCEQGITLTPGESAKVIGRRNLTLLVTPARPEYTDRSTESSESENLHMT